MSSNSSQIGKSFPCLVYLVNLSKQTWIQVFSNCLRSSGRTGIIASEEEDVPVAVEESYSGNYIVVFDPLDGSSNIDAAVSTGSIFGIYSPNDECFADIGDDTTVIPCASQCIPNHNFKRTKETNTNFLLARTKQSWNSLYLLYKTYFYVNAPRCSWTQHQKGAS